MQVRGHLWPSLSRRRPRAVVAGISEAQQVSQKHSRLRRNTKSSSHCEREQDMDRAEHALPVNVSGICCCVSLT